jgi:hypothetical protein
MLLGGLGGRIRVTSREGYEEREAGMEETVTGGGQALRERPPETDADPGQEPSPPRPRRGGEARPAGRGRRLHDDRLFGDVLAVKRWLARRHGE